MKNKLRLAAPPLIIFLDFLSQFLFVSMVQQTPHIELNIPKDKLFAGGQIIYQTSNRDIKYFDGNKFKKLDNGFGGSFYISRPCIESVCEKVKKYLPQNVEPKIAITGQLFSNLSQLTFLACATDANQCNNIRYDILADGTINTDALVKYNPLFNKINGLEAF